MTGWIRLREILIKWPESSRNTTAMEKNMLKMKQALFLKIRIDPGMKLGHITVWPGVIILK